MTTEDRELGSGETPNLTSACSIHARSAPWYENPTFMASFHKWASVAWILAVVPALLWWRDSVLFVIFISLWANVASHWACYQAARAEIKS